jgi:hypothetical protein
MKNRSYIIISPVFIVALIALFINDFYLKNKFPGLLTGKLSDIAGLFIFPVFIYFIYGKNKLRIYIATAIAFTWWKSSLSQIFIDLYNVLSPLKIGRVIDYTDLFTLLILPFSYYYKFDCNKKLNNNFIRYSLSIFTLFVIVASETIDVKFKNKVKGYTPWGLVGNYNIYYFDADTSYVDTISIALLKRRKYVIVKNNYDTLYTGDIVKFKGNFYLNKFDQTDKYWQINSFRIDNDSIYNFYETFYSPNLVSIENNTFKNIVKTEKEDEIIYYVNNDKSETINAFNKLIDQSKGYLIKEIILQSNTATDDSAFDKIKKPLPINFTVYPNPFSEQITIAHRLNTKYTARILSIHGEVLNTIASDEMLTKINTSNLNKGTYLLELTDVYHNIETVKLIKQ